MMKVQSFRTTAPQPSGQTAGHTPPTERGVSTYSLASAIEEPVNLSTAIYMGVFSRAEQRVLQAIFKAIMEGGGRCVGTLAMLARNSNTSRSTTRNAINRAVEIGLLEKMERRSFCAVSLPNILTYGKR